MLNQIKGLLWRSLYTPYYRVKYYLTRVTRAQIPILNSEQTIEHILQNRCSVSRMGDGEFQMITQRLYGGLNADYEIDTFQDYETDLADRLITIFHTPSSKHLLCIPYTYRDSTIYRGYERTFCEREFLYRWPQLQRLEPTMALYGDALFSRFYMSRKDINNYHAYVTKLKKIWAMRDVWIIEGCKSRLGVGNDMFDGARTIHRIICPATNAYAKYDEIFSAIKHHIPQNNDTLILIALGHTATVLAYDLAQEGFQAIDIGHVDVEYEWMLMGATKKVPIPGKYVNEVQEGRIVQSCRDKNYLSQIVYSIQ